EEFLGTRQGFDFAGGVAAISEIGQQRVRPGQACRLDEQVQIGNLADADVRVEALAEPRAFERPVAQAGGGERGGYTRLLRSQPEVAQAVGAVNRFQALAVDDRKREMPGADREE